MVQTVPRSLTLVSQTPSITVVVPYHNEQDNLEYLLDQLAAQTLQPKEVILVNSGSTDASSALVEDWITNNDLRPTFKNLNASTKTPGGSKSAGIKVASGDLLAFMDCGLTFPTNWLESQAHLLTSTGADWVSGVCHTSGTTLIDKSAIAHTYGYKSSRPVIPSSVIRRSVFGRIGVFKDLRAGYDAEWARASIRAGLRREINPNVIVEYQSVNFADTLYSVFTKSLRYAKPSVGRNDTVVPYVYLVGSIVAVLLLTLSPVLTLILAASYFAARLTIARRKSQEFRYFRTSPFRIVVLLIVGLVMDFGKLLGFSLGIITRFVGRRSLS